MLKEIRFNRRLLRAFGNCNRAIGFAIALLIAGPSIQIALAANLPTLVGTPTLIVDQANSATTIIILSNPTKQLMKNGVLSARDFFSQTTKLPLGTRLAFSVPGAQGGTLVYNIDDMPPGSTKIVKVDVSNLWQAGESTADLEYNGTKIGTLKAIKYLVPFAVSLQSATPDNPTITLKHKQPGTLTLKNDDAMNYPVRWELTIEDKKVSGSVLQLPPKGTASVEFNTMPTWFAWYRGIFKENLQDGLLTLELSTPEGLSGVPIQMKSIPLKARLLYWSPLCQQLIGTFVIFIVLSLGGGCSLAISYWVPNRLRQSNLDEQLAVLAVKIRELTSEHIDSSLRVLVRVQRHRLRQLLFSRWLLSPDLVTAFSQCDRGIATLNRQVTLLKNIDISYDQLKKAADEFQPPTLLNRIEKKLKEAENRLGNLEPQEADFQAAQGLITEAEKRLAALEQDDPTFAQELASRVNNLIKDFKDPLDNTQQYKSLKTIMTTTFDYLDPKYADPKNITITIYARLDINTTKLKVIQQYLENYGSTTIDASLHENLVEHLRHDSWQELRAAQQLLRQVREGILETTISKEIKTKPPHIEIDPGVARPYLPVRFSIFFDRNALNGSAARDRFKCEWNFGDDLTESGWEVSHYFFKERENAYTVKTQFISPDGKPVKNHEDKVVTVKKDIMMQTDPAENPNDLLKTEIIYLGIVLFAALLALIGGAREQLAKMDLIPGIIGVFILGFTADQIKNLLTQRTPGDERK